MNIRIFSRHAPLYPVAEILFDPSIVGKILQLGSRRLQTANAIDLKFLWRTLFIQNLGQKFVLFYS